VSSARTWLGARLAALLASLIGAAGLPAAGGAAPPPGQPIASGKRILRHEGRLEDGKNRPLGGIYALTFGIHAGPKGATPHWSESHFVAVDSGHYEVELGHQRAFATDRPLAGAYLSVGVTGGAELVREQVQAGAVVTVEVAAAARIGTAATPTQPAGPPQPAAPPSGRAVVDYAETAGLALVAETAKRADKLGKLSEADIRELAAKTAPKVEVGRNVQESAKAGGPGGQPFDLSCPKGYVAIGVRGNSAAYVSSLQVICAKLE
jgi:hypothetical protein